MLPSDTNCSRGQNAIYANLFTCPKIVSSLSHYSSNFGSAEEDLASFTYLYAVLCFHIMYGTQLLVYFISSHLMVTTKETGLEVNVDKTKYMVMSREQTAGLSHTVKVNNSSIERVEEFKYLGTTLTNENSIQKEIKSRLKLGNACYHSV